MIPLVAASLFDVAVTDPETAVLEWVLSNTAIATALGLTARLLAVSGRRPAAGHALFGLALACLLSPPLLHVELAWPARTADTPAVVEATSRPVAPADAVASGLTPQAGARQTKSPDLSIRPDDTAAANARDGAPRAMPANALTTPPETRTSPSTVAVLGGIWLLGSLLRAAWLLARQRQGTRRLEHLTGAPSASLTGQLETLGLELGLRRLPRLRVCSGIGPALRTRPGRAEILFPAELLTTVDPLTRRALLLHELAHYARGDHLVRLLEAVVTTVLWWHPAPWLLRAGLREAEERACDAWVTRHLPDARRRYGEALVDLGAGTLPALFTPASPRRLRTWQRRLESLMSDHPEPRSSRTRRTLLAAVAIGCLPLGLVQDPDRAAGASLEDWQRRLDTERVTVEFDDAPLATWTARLGRELGAPVNLTETATNLPAESTALTGMRLTRTTLRKTLEVCSTLSELRWELTERGLRFDTRPEPREAAPVASLLGAWVAPGRVELAEQTTLLELLAQNPAQRSADLSRVLLVRSELGEALSLTIDAAAMLSSGATTDNVLIRPDDTVVLHPGSRVSSSEAGGAGTLTALLGGAEGSGPTRELLALNEIMARVKASNTDRPDSSSELQATKLRPGMRLRFFLYGMDEAAGAEDLAFLEQPQPVAADGTIFVPYVGPLNANGLTEQEVAKQATEQLQAIFAHARMVHARIVPE